MLSSRSLPMGLKDILRRAYLLVLRHSWGVNAPPVFIVGAPRTGSSFMTRALIYGAGFSGSSEGHVTPLMANLDRILRGYYSQMRETGMLAIPENTVSKIPEQELARAITAVFCRFHRRIFLRGIRLLDKTVNMEAIEALPYLLTMWPEARVIYLTRDGVDNVVSAQNYFGVTLEIAARNWAQCGRAWDWTAPKLDPSSYLTVSQNDLTSNPLAVAGRIAKHLKLPPWRKKRFLRNVMHYTPDWRSSRAERPPLSELPWTREDRFTFLSICGGQMVLQGYAAQAEVDAALAECTPQSRSLDSKRIRVLNIDDADFFRPLDDGFLAVPGRESPCVLSYDAVETNGLRTLVGRFTSSHPGAHSVRVEVTAISCEDGSLLGHETFEIATLASQSMAMQFAHDTHLVDVLIRVVIGRDASTNDNSWVNFSGLALV